MAFAYGVTPQSQVRLRCTGHTGRVATIGLNNDATLSSPRLVDNLLAAGIVSALTICLQQALSWPCNAGTLFREGDILLMRSGWTIAYMKLTNEEKITFSEAVPTVLVGVQTSIKIAKWLWDTGFSASGGDSLGCELWPALLGEGEVCGQGSLRLHEVMPNGWGMPIGKSCPP